MINRREFLGTTLGAGATLAFTPELLRALQLEPLHQQGGKLRPKPLSPALRRLQPPRSWPRCVRSCIHTFSSTRCTRWCSSFR